MAEKVEILDLQIETSSAVANTKKLAEEVALLKAQTAKAKAENGELSEEYIQYNAALKSAQKEMRANERVLQSLTQAETAEAGTIEKLQAQNKELTQERKKLNLETKEGRERLIEINEVLNKNNTFIKENSDKVTQQKINVGNYKDSVVEALSEVQNLNPAFGAAGEATQGFGDKLKLLARNPIVLILTAIVGSLTAIFGAFKKTQRGADLFAKGSAAVNAVLEVLTGLLAGAADKIIAFFEDPKQAITDFGDLIKENILFRVRSIIEGLGGLGTAIKLLFEGEFGEAADKAKEAFEQLGEAAIGVEFETVAEVVEDLTDKVEQSVKSAIKYKNAEIALQNAVANTTKALAQQRKVAEVNAAIADDNTRSLVERDKAARVSAEAAEKANRTAKR